MTGQPPARPPWEEPTQPGEAPARRDPAPGAPAAEPTGYADTAPYFEPGQPAAPQPVQPQPVVYQVPMMYTYMVQPQAQPMAQPPQNLPPEDPGPRPISLHVAVALLLAELVAGVFGLTMLKDQLDAAVSAAANPGIAWPVRDVVMYSSVATVVGWTLLCLWFGTYTYLGRTWARVLLTITLILKAVANLFGTWLGSSAVRAGLQVSEFGSGRTMFALVLAAVDVAILVLLWRDPVGRWVRAKAAYRRAQLADED